MITRTEAFIGAEVGSGEIASDIVLFADEDQLPRRSSVRVPQKILRRQAKVLQAECGEPFGGRNVGIKIVFVQIAAGEPDTLAVPANQKARASKQNRHKEIGDHIIEPSHAFPLSSGGERT